MSDKDFKVKNKLQVKGITSAGPVVSDASGNLDSTSYVATQYGGTGTTTSPSSGQIPYSSSGTTYAPTTLTSLDVKGATYASSAPSSPVVGQIWVDSSSTGTSVDPNLIRRQAFTSTAAQTVYTTNVAFIDGYEQVFFNGMLLLRTTDYTTSGNNTITLTSAAAVNDIVEVVTVTNLNSTNTYTQSEIDTALSAKLSTSTAASTYLTQSNASSTYAPLSSPTFTVASGTAVPLTIQNNGTGNSFVVNDTSSDTTPFTIDANGLVWIGDTTDLSNVPELNMVVSTETASGHSLVIRKSVNGANSSNISLARSRGTNASPAILQDGDGIGGYVFHGYDGTNYLQVAAITANVDGVPGSADMPTRLSFATAADGSNVHTERMRIDSSGNISMATAYTTLSGTAGNGQWRIRGKYNADTAPYQSDMITSINWNTVTNTQDVSVNGSAYTVLGGGSNGYSAFAVYTGGNAATPAERFRIDSLGKVGIGAPSVSGMLEVTHVDATAPRFISTSNNNNKLMVFEGYAGNLWNIWGGHGGGSYFGISENASTTPVFAITGSTNYALIGYTASQGAYKLQVNSQIFATSSSIATSDGRYKENVDTISGGLGIIDSLRPVSFTWKDHPVHNFVAGKTVGFIAQEVKEALSEYDWVDNIIKTNTSEAVLDEEGNEVTPAEEFLGIAESNIIPLLVAAVKELKARVETLENNNV